MFLKGENVGFSYTSEKKVLNEVDFAVQKSETLSIVGASGCGKSTLLRIISGILPNTKSNQLYGQIFINDQTPDEYRKSGKLAFMFQESTLMPNLTVKENIAFPLKIKGVKDNEKVTNLLHTVGLEEHSNKLPKELSGGMKTRVALARSFVIEPELLLLDEPFSALDIAWKSDLYKSLERLAEEFGTTIIMVTHDVQEALLLSNKVIVLNRFGENQAEHEVKSKTTLPERVNNINDFLKEVYEDLFLPIQQAIMTDGKRANITTNDVLQVLDEVIEIAGKEQSEKLITKDKLDSIRDFSNNPDVNKKLLLAFKKAKTKYLKYQLIWDILEFRELPESIHRELFNYYLENIINFSEYSRDWYVLHSNERFFEILQGRIETSRGFNQKKKWIYLCDLYAVKDLPEVNQFFDAVINGEVSQLNYQFAKEVAQKVKAKIKNEKVDVVHIA